MSEWPKLDPITQRMICQACWNNVHRRRNVQNILVDACTGECDCVHRSEETWAALERQTLRQNKDAKRKLLREQLEESPLAVVNDSFKPKKKGRAHA